MIRNFNLNFFVYSISKTKLGAVSHEENFHRILNPFASFIRTEEEKRKIEDLIDEILKKVEKFYSTDERSKL
jgi:hypothetical protein